MLTCFVKKLLAVCPQTLHVFSSSSIPLPSQWVSRGSEISTGKILIPEKQERAIEEKTVNKSITFLLTIYFSHRIIFFALKNLKFFSTKCPDYLHSSHPIPKLSNTKLFIHFNGNYNCNIMERACTLKAQSKAAQCWR